MASTLAGVAAAIESGDAADLDAGIERMLMLYSIAFGYGGIPIIYMGDELCMLDDQTYLDDPLRQADSRWCHRPVFDDAVAARRTVVGSPEQRLWDGIRHLVAARRACLPLHGATTSRPVDVGHPTVFGWHRQHPRFGELLVAVRDQEERVRFLGYDPALVKSVAYAAAAFTAGLAGALFV
ncbi:MAG: hypothetical protein KDB37_23380, partial [Ilumatobacter sp.]|nr:hypothetical protein [Ilumatobacter sp.]